ncbi:MAG: hypothetical protein ACI35O_12800 [Bacillaceae bacterium]
MSMKKRYVLIGIAIVMIITFAYYMTPLTADKVLYKSKIVKIHFGFYKNGIYEVEFTKQEEINQILNKFDDSKYTRVPLYNNIRNDGKFLSMVLFEEDLTSHILDINDQGYLRIDGNTYKLTKHQSKIFNELYEMLVPNHKPVN